MKFLKSMIGQTSPLRLAYHRAKALFAALQYGFPARKLTVIGITGTDGKTTTVGMIAHILNNSGHKSGALSTAFFQVGTTIRWNPTQKTSPSPFLVQQFLRELVTAGCTHAVLECSSHGLLQGRVNYTYPTVAGITNLSEEHLDYHGTMEAYLAAKAKLFMMLHKKEGIAVLNADDQSFSQLSGIPYPALIQYSLTEPHPDNPSEHYLWSSDIDARPQSVTATLHTNAEEEVFDLHIPVAGAFNVANALCAIGCSHAVGIEYKDCVKALRSFTGISGRMERIEEGQDFLVFVDFTVTPKSYQATLTTLRSMLTPNKRLLVLTGSCGDRMKEKRPVIGGICASLADVVVVTNEDPYTEDPEKIIDDVLVGIPNSMPIYHGAASIPTDFPLYMNKFCIRISDRLEAIKWILSQAQSGDIILLSGKGTDITMMTKSGQIPWNEREIVRASIAKLQAQE